jgi:transportin-3
MTVFYKLFLASDLALAEKVLKCLLSWIKTNDIGIKELQSSPIVAVTFQALQSDDLFDTATDVVVEIIHECSRSLDKCLPFIQSLCPLLGGLLPLIQQCNQHPDEFEDKQRGLTRIFAEAGEIFLPLILQSLDNFRDLMNGIVGCSSFSDLEVVPILFNFWMDLTSRLSDKSGEQIKPLFVDYYRQLSAGMIKHLRLEYHN